MANKQEFDVAVIGAGPGGYVAAIKAAQEGKKVALIEKNALGGTCLNVGCIPSKTLLSNAQVLRQIKESGNFGIHVEGVSFDYAKMKHRKDNVVSNIKKSLTGLLASNKINIFSGEAKFDSPNELKILGKDQCLIQAKHTIIATGSEILNIPAFPCDGKRIHHSTSILELKELPKTLAIIGGGYIGCEFASLFAELGVKVTIVEALPTIIQAQGKTLSSALTASFKKKGIDILVNTVVEKIETKENGLDIHLKGSEKLECEMSLVAVGRRIHSEGLGLEKIGLKVGEKGEIKINDQMQTDIPNIYAIGDVTGKAMLAHVASHQGIVAASHICGKEAHINYNAIPAVIFTHPEIATVGMTKEEAQAKNFTVTAGKFPFQALGKSIAAMETEGFTEVISDKNTGEILGAQVIGYGASIMIGEMALAINNELTLECVLETIHAHPTVSEAWLEAALIANETPIHFPPKIK